MNYLTTQQFTLPNTSTYSLPAPWISSWVGILSVTILSAYLVQRVFDWLDYPVLSPLEIAWNAYVYVMPLPFVTGLNSRSLSRVRSNGPNTPSGQHAEKSEILRNAFGLGGGGLLGGAAAQVHAPKGLGNWDNSCYQNSILQALASLPSLGHFLTRVDQELDSSPDTTTLFTLRRLIEDVNDTSNHRKYLWTPPKLKSMSSWQQQDAQEYFSKLIEALEKEVVGRVRNKNLGPASAGLDNLFKEDSRMSQLAAENEVGQATQTQSVLPLEALKNKALPGEQMFQNPLEGLLAQRVGCTQCGYTEGLSLIPFNCMTLPLGRKPHYDLYECLSDSTSLERIEGVECGKCTLLETKQRLHKILKNMHAALHEHTEPRPGSCEISRGSSDLIVRIEKKLQAVNDSLQDEDFSDTSLTQKCQIPKNFRATSTKSRQAIIMRAPQCLVLHVNRSMFNEYTGELLKNYAEVQYPKRLHLGPWSVGSDSTSDLKDRHPSREEWEMDPSRSMIPHSDSVGLGQGPCYELRAAVTHFGRHENGHYVCYRRLPDKVPRGAHPIEEKEITDTVSEGCNAEVDKWWGISDDIVTAVNEEDVLAQNSVFMLFYERVEQNLSPEKAEEDPNTMVAPDTVSEVAKPALKENYEESAIEAPQLEEPRRDEQTHHHDAGIPPPALVPLPLPSSNDIRVRGLYPGECLAEHDKQSVELASSDHALSNSEEADEAPVPTVPKTRAFTPPVMRTAGPGYLIQEDGRSPPPRVIATT